MKIYLTVTVEFDEQEPATKHLEFAGLREGATLIDVPQIPILSAIKELSSLGVIRGYSVNLVGSSTAD